MSTEHREIDPTDHCRANALLREATPSEPDTVPVGVYIAAYQAVLLKDIRFALNELLNYRRNEVHR